jgi:dipeptidyl aminopeptidase/acylaminoacyl peptidase
MILRRIALAALVLLFCGAGASWYVGGKLMAPVPSEVGHPPAELNAQAVTFASKSGSQIHGWFAPGKAGKGAVLLLHGVRADRRDMVSRAQFLHARGFAVLLIDFQAHGESAGNHITFGDLESWDAIAAIDFLRRSLPDERIGVIGISLGAASVVLAKQPLPIDAVVLESMYPTIEEAVADRLRLHLGSWGAMGAPLLLGQMKPRLGVGPERLRPIDHIAKLGAPLLLLHGSLDRHTSLDEARQVYAAASEPKSLWEVSGAAHVNLHRYAAREYEQRVGEWFERYLTQPG